MKLLESFIEAPVLSSREIHRGTVKQRNSDYLFFTNYYADAGQAIYEKHCSHCHSKGLLKNHVDTSLTSYKTLKRHLDRLVLMALFIIFKLNILNLNVLQRQLYIVILTKIF